MYCVNPDQEFTVAFRRMNNGWAIIHSLRMVSTAGMPYAAKIVKVEQTSLVSDLTVSGQLKEFIIGMVNDDDLKKTADFLSQQLTEQTLKNASSSVDAHRCFSRTLCWRTASILSWELHLTLRLSFGRTG
jgi:hypothetical protein